MHKRLHLPALALIAGLLLLGLSSCGGGSSADTVATVGKTEISKSTLSHWMSTMVGGDYQEIVGSTAPAGLVSEPANYPRCVAAAKQIVRSLPSSVPNAQRLGVRCRQLHTAVKEQALSYLISALWRAEEGAEVGHSVSDAEVSRQLRTIAYKEYPSPAAFRRFLASRHWSLADERYLLKRNLLDGKFLERLKHRAAALGGGEKTFGKLVQQNVAKWSSKTKCSQGYTAWQCRPGGSTAEASPSPAQLVTQLAGVSQ